MKYVKPITLYRGLLKASPPKRLLGLDVGDKYVGVAVSDSMNKIASPLSVLVRKKTNIDLMAKDFQTLISELSIDALVIGCCYQRQRTSLNAVQIKLFVRELCKTGKVEGLKYTYWDERFTSKCVEALLQHLHLHPVTSKTILDKFAAVGILQDYLDYMQKNSELEDLDYMQKTSELEDMDLLQKKTEMEDSDYLQKSSELEDLDYIQKNSESGKSL